MSTDTGGTIGEIMEHGLYEFVGFNQVVAEAPDRATLHRDPLFDEPSTLADWLLGSSDSTMASHLNEHIRGHELGPAIAAAAWLGLRATDDGSSLRFFLRVGARPGAKVGAVTGMDGFVAVVIEVETSWPYFKTDPAALAPAALLTERWEQYERDSISVRPGAVPLVMNPSLNG